MRISLKHWLRQRREPWRKVFYQAYKRWRRDGMEAKRYVFDGLDQASVIFDVGGFEGNWAQDMFDRYGSTIHVFEPHPAFAAKLEERFAGNPKIHVHAFALGREPGTLNLSDAGDASSAVSDAQSSVTGELRSAADFMSELEAPTVHLAKINIEGGEYDLLPALHSAGALPRFGMIQVQFHLFRETDQGLRDAVRTQLSETHAQAWAYPFVWEEWHVKAA